MHEDTGTGADRLDRAIDGLTGKQIKDLTLDYFNVLQLCGSLLRHRRRAKNEIADQERRRLDAEFQATERADEIVALRSALRWALRSRAVYLGSLDLSEMMGRGWDTHSEKGCCALCDLDPATLEPLDRPNDQTNRAEVQS